MRLIAAIDRFRCAERLSLVASAAGGTVSCGHRTSGLLVPPRTVSIVDGVRTARIAADYR